MFVNYEPLLTGFPRTLFGRAKRSEQDSFTKKKAKLSKLPTGALAKLAEPLLEPEFMTSISQSKRRRIYDDVSVFWAWIGQILESNSSCNSAVQEISSSRRLADLKRPSAATGAYCRARERLSIGFLEKVAERLHQRISENIDANNLWGGLELKAIDGSSVQLLDTPANQEAFPQPPQQKEGCGFPVMGICSVLNCSSGAWENVTTSKWSRHDMQGAYDMLDSYSEGDLMIADRAFCAYGLMVALQQQGAESLMRLHQARAKALDWRRGKKISPNQRLVTWKKGTRSKNSPFTKKEWDAMPKELTVRLIRVKYLNREKKKSTMYLATSLLDHVKYTEEKAGEIYLRRWAIELSFRDLKTSLNLELLRVKDPDMATKTLMIAIIAYNLVKALAQQSCLRHGKSLASVSFKESVDTILKNQIVYVGLGKSKRARVELYDELLELLSQKSLVFRPGRWEPRALKRRPKGYQLLTKPRHEFIEIQHRYTYKRGA